MTANTLGQHVSAILYEFLERDDIKGPIAIATTLGTPLGIIPTILTEDISLFPYR